MQEEVLVAVMLAAVAITFWGPFRRIRAWFGVDHLLVTGHVFLVVGYVAGLALGSNPTIERDLDPIVGFVSGWIGFAAGSRFDWRILRTLPPRAYAAALAPALAASALVGGASFAVLWLAGHPLVQAGAAAIVLAAAAASSGPTLPALARMRRAGRSVEARATLRLVEFSAGIDDVVVLGLAALSFGLLRPEANGDGSVLLVALNIGGGAALGLATWLFLGGRAGRDERLLLGVAMIVFTAGAAAWLHVSTAAAAASAAVVVVNLPGNRMVRLLNAVRRVERPAVVIVMTVAGWHLGHTLTSGFLPLILAMTVVRLAAKVVAGDRVAALARRGGFAARPGWGLGLTAQGVLGVVVALTFLTHWDDDLGYTVLAVVAFGSLLNELVAPFTLIRLLRTDAPDREAA